METIQLAMRPLYHNLDPMKPVDWRWQTVVQLVALSLRRDRKHIQIRLPRDKYIRDGYHTLRLLNAAEAPLVKAQNKCPKAFFAHRIRETNPNLDPAKWVIESRVLAGEDIPTIASKTGIDPAIIAYYIALFFDLGGKLDSQDFILRRVFGTMLNRGLVEGDNEFLWKLFAYFGGPGALDVALYQVTRRKSHDCENSSAFIHDATKSALGIKAVVAARTVPVNGFTAAGILQVYNQMLELEKDRATSGGDSGNLVTHLGAMLEGMNWTTGARAQREMSSPAVLEYDNLAAELRSEELLAVHGGDDKYSELKAITFRPPEPSTIDAEANQTS